MSAPDCLIKVANAPCSFGVMAGFQPDPPITYLDVLDQIAEAGFAGTELGDWGFMSLDPAVLAPELQVRGLAMVGAFTPLELSDPANLKPAINTALRTARLLAAVAHPESSPGPYLVLAADASRHPLRRQIAGRVSAVDTLTDEEWDALARGAETIARTVRDETGIATVFHPHCGTPVETLAETARFAEITDSGLIGLCFDTGHVAYAGDDPSAWLSLFAPRTRLVHFKDMDPAIAAEARSREWDYTTAVRAGLFCPMGDGSVDFNAAHRILVDSGYHGWIVVEDEIPPGRIAPLLTAKQDREFLRGLGL